MKSNYSLLAVFGTCKTLPAILLESTWNHKWVDSVPELVEVLEESHFEPLAPEEKAKLETIDKLLLIEGPGSAESLRTLFQTLLQTEAIAFYIQSCGKTLLPKDVEALCEDSNENLLLDAAIQFFWDEDKMLTQGMDSLGYADLGIKGLHADEAQLVLETILLNVFEGNGLIEESEKFQLPSEQKFRLKAAPEWEIPPGEVGHNPYGILRLVENL